MRLADVISSERVVEEGASYLRVKLDPIDTVMVPSFDDSGDDSPPLPGDKAVCDDDHCFGFADVRNAGVALPGEKRLYARDEDGAVVGAVYLKRDGTLELGLNATGRVAVAALVNAEIQRIYDAVANWVPLPVPNDGGAAVAAGLQSAFAEASAGVQSVESATVMVQP